MTLTDRSALEPMGEGYAVLLDELGAVAILTMPAGVRRPRPETGVRLDLGGKWNKLPGRYFGRYLMAVGQAAELVAELTVAAKQTAEGDSFDDEVAEYVRRLESRGIV